MMDHLCRCGVYFAICISIGRMASGQAVQLDQIHAVPPNPNQANAYGLSSFTEAAQTFTVGVSGTLANIDVGLYRPSSAFEGTIVVDISRVVAGVPDFSEAGVLARRTVSNSTIPVLSVFDVFTPVFSLSVDFSDTSLNVTPGNTLAIILRPNTTGSDYYNWWANVAGGPSYAGGKFFQRQTSNGSITDAGTQYDAHFRTFVLVPEPSSLALGVLAVLGLVASIQRRC
jgi:hypothetical protein